MISGDVDFFRELMQFYSLHKRKLKKALLMKGDNQLVDFCSDFSDFRHMTSRNEPRFIKHEYVCKLALIFSNVLGTRLPDHLHARMVFGFSDSCKQYIEYVEGLRPRTLFGMVNPNPNHFRMHRLSVSGTLSKLVSK